MHVALLEGRPFTTTVPFGGDLASMRGVIHHGQSLTLTPIDQHGTLQAGDIVYVRWRGDNYILHLVGEVAGDTLLIMNSQGGSNGWIGTSDVLAVVTKMSTPEPPASVQERLAELDAIIGSLVERVTEEDRELVGALVCLVDGFKWYADHLGPEWWDRAPKQNQWTYAQRLGYFVHCSRTSRADPHLSLLELVHSGVEQLGLLAHTALLLANPKRKHLDSWH